MRVFLQKERQSPKSANKTHTGKQTVRQLVGQGVGVSNIEISDKNIKVFESVARKYGVDYALKRDSSGDIPRWLVFFKGRDADVITSAFKEFSAKQITRDNESPTILENLRNLMARVKNQTIDKTKHKDRGREL